MKLYKDSYNKFWIENETCPSGVYSISFSEDNLICIIRNISTQAIRYNGLVTGLLKENGATYTNRTDLETLVSDFFVKAPAVGGGYYTISTSVSGTASIQLEFGKATISSNTLTSTDIITLTLATTTSTEIGEYIYSFTTGTTAPTITWPIECKESIVISPNKKYLISFVRVSATKVFTFIDEEAV